MRVAKSAELASKPKIILSRDGLSSMKIDCQGSCHCNAVVFHISSDVQEKTSCDCSMCIRRATTMIKVHESEFTLLQGQEQLVEYQFHTNTATHYFCGKCGIYPFHRKRVTPDFYGINVNCLKNVDLGELPVRETNGSKMD